MLEITTRPNATTAARRRVIGPLVLALIAGIAGGAEGQPPDPAASTPAVQLFTGARVIIGDGRVIDEAAFLVRGGVIVQVGSAGEVTAPPGAAVVDLTGRTVMPALVNTHAHLGWERYTSWGSENFTRENLVDHLHRHAYYGVGTIISTGSDLEEVALEVRLAQRVGEVGGARYLVSPGVGTPGGGPNPRFTNDAGWWGLHAVTTPAEARDVVRTEAARGVRILKIWVDSRDERRGARVKLAPDIYAAALDEAAVRDVRVIAHATTLEDHKRLLRAGARRFIHMPYDVAVDDEYLGLVAARNAFIVPTLGMVTRREPYRRPVYEDPFFQEQVPDEVVAMLRDAAAGDDAPPRTAAAEARARVIRDNFMRLRDHVIFGTDAGAVGRLLRLRRSPGAGALRAAGHDAGRGHRGRHDAGGGGVRAGRNRGRRGRPERRLRGARRQPARRHHAHAADRRGVPAGRRGRPRGLAGALDGVTARYPAPIDGESGASASPLPHPDDGRPVEGDAGNAFAGAQPGGIVASGELVLPFAPGRPPEGARCHRAQWSDESHDGGRAPLGRLRALGRSANHRITGLSRRNDDMKYRLLVLLTFAAALVMPQIGAHAHFQLLEPAPWINLDRLGNPQKVGPCGGNPNGDNAEILSGIVTEVTGGSNLHLKIQETVFHSGHYRVALSVNSRNELPADTTAVEKWTDRGLYSVWGVIQSPPQIPVLADGLFPHYPVGDQRASFRPETPMDPWEADIPIPNINCEKCTLQVIQFMADHVYNTPGGYSYHHCADLKITADPSKPIDDRWPAAQMTN